MSLVKTWLLHYMSKGLTKRAALDALNKVTGRKYEHGHLLRWERGVREPGFKARTEMLRIALNDLYPHLPPSEIKALVEKLR